MNTQFVSELDLHGYFRGLSEERADASKAEFLLRGWMGMFFGESHRMFMSDAEELAEGGVSAFVARVGPFLCAQGVVMPTVEDVHSEVGYSIRIGNRTKRIYGIEEMRRDERNEPGLVWGLSMIRGFSFVDDLLESAGSQERLYAVNGGNDLSAFFLTPDLHRIISAHPEAKHSGGPYKPTAVYPAFGQPSD